MPGNKLFTLFSPIASLLPAAAAAWALAMPGTFRSGSQCRS